MKMRHIIDKKGTPKGIHVFGTIDSLRKPSDTQLMQIIKFFIIFMREDKFQL